jgi:hypothetical protein
VTDANDPVDVAPDYAHANGWDREYEAFGAFDVPTEVTAMAATRCAMEATAALAAGQAAGTPVRFAGRGTRSA